MPDEKSIVGKVEQNLADLGRVRQKKPWLFYLLIIAFIVVGGLYVFDKLWGIPSLNKKIEGQKEEIRDLKSDRDAKAAQLAPFLAVANKQFRDPSEPERLNKLLQLVQDLTTRMKEVSASLPKQRKLNDEDATKLIAVLKQNTKYELKISYEQSQRETSQLAMQLKGIFESSGWKVSIGSLMSFWSGTQPSFEITVNQMPPQEVQIAIADLLEALHLPKNVVQNTNLPPNQLKIYIGPQ